MDNNTNNQVNNRNNGTAGDNNHAVNGPGNKDGNGGQVSGQSKSSGQRRKRAILVRYGKMGFVGQFRHSEREIPAGITHVVAKTERGMEIGEIISPFFHRRGSCTIPSEQIDRYYKANGSSYPISTHGTVVRFASNTDLNDQHHLDANIKDKLRFCQQLINKKNLSMKLIDAEYLFGGERMIFYFMADGRVDFRDLVKELAHEFQTRIEMRQVGARDEARLVGDYETCGRECCCKNFLKVLQPVNMRMAKLQKATLDPSKISGRCGRLKCCLRYEDQVYTELYKKLPRRNSRVLTEDGTAIVIEAQVLTQLVKIRLEESGRIVAISNDEIIKQNYKDTDKEEARVQKSQANTRVPPKTPSAGRTPPKKKDVEPVSAEAAATGNPDQKESAEAEQKKSRSGRRRRRRKKKKM